MPNRVIKRDGRIVKFNPDKISAAIIRAMESVDMVDNALAEDITNNIIVNLGEASEVGVEEIQDLVEDALIGFAEPRLAKAYILYRAKRGETREIRELLDIEGNHIKFNPNALVLLNERYLKVLEGRKESPVHMFKRVADCVASVESRYGENPSKWSHTFYKLLSDRIFLPNTPTLSNAGMSNYLQACFLLPVEDSMKSILKAVYDSGILMQAGGGIGLVFSHLRPEGDKVGEMGGISSGPLSFMRIFDVTADVTKQGSIRRGGCMGVLKVNHPDILKFIQCKQQEGALSNFNISVALTKEFFDAYEKGETIPLINPRNNEVVTTIDANHILSLLAQQAWSNGEPGVIFLDNINKDNPLLKDWGEIEGVNLCSEISFYPYESCTLASINLTKFVDNGEISWRSLRKVVKHAIRFLDDVIDASNYTLPEIEEISKQTRRIGLGVMGFADMLFMLEVPYDSDEALRLADDIMSFISKESIKESERLAKDRGVFPAYNQSMDISPRRNVEVNTVAPTGSVSVIAECSSGIEPIFAVVFRKENILGGKTFTEINPVFEAIAKREGWFNEELISDIIDNDGRVTGLERVPEKWQRIFKTALEINPEQHVKIQAAFQRHVGNSISKTINMPFSATVDDVKSMILLSHELGCKGITVYRNASRQKQVLNVKSSSRNKCPSCGSDLIATEGCLKCVSCNYARCDLN